MKPHEVPQDLPRSEKPVRTALGMMAEDYEWYTIEKGYWYGHFETYTSHRFTVKDKLRKATEEEKKLYA